MAGSIVIKTLEGADLSEAARLWLACFEEDDSAFVSYYFENRTAPERMLGLFLDGTLASMLCLDPAQMNTGKGSVPVCFIAGVCTLPAFRRRGFVRALIENAERRMQNDGAAALLLQPFDFDFYSKLGFEPYARRSLLAPKASETELKAQSVPATAELMMKVYTACMGGRRGALKRDLRYFKALEKEFSLPGACSEALMTDDGAAYALYYGAEEGGSITAEEFAYSSEKAGEALLNALSKKPFTLLLPVREGTELRCARRVDSGFFNMIKRLRLFEEELDGGAPFDMRKY